jgi:hypothetical protein
MVPFVSTSLTIFVVVCVFDGRHSNRSEMKCYLGFDIIYFMARDGENFFMCILAIGLLSLRKICLVHLSIFSLGQ